MVSMIKFEHAIKPHPMLEYGLIQVYDNEGSVAGSITYQEIGPGEYSYTTFIKSDEAAVAEAYDMVDDHTSSGGIIETLFDKADHCEVDTIHLRRVG